MSRGNHTWFVIENGERVVKQCSVKNISVPFPIPILASLTALSKKKGQSVLSIVRTAVLEYLEKNINAQ